MGVAALVVVGPGVATAGADLLRPELLAFGFAVAVLSSVVPFTLETEALRRLPAGVFGVLMSLEPAVAALVGLVALGQGLVAREVVAMALVVAASAGATRSGAPPPAAPPDPA
jgi:inner membrane transporter RhtA